MTEMEWTDDGEEAREANADKEFDEAISQALDATHEEMEAKQAEADEAAQELSLIHIWVQSRTRRRYFRR